MLASSELLASTGRAELGPERSGASSGALSARRRRYEPCSEPRPPLEIFGTPGPSGSGRALVRAFARSGAPAYAAAASDGREAVSLAGGGSRDWSLRRGPALLPRRHGYPAGRLMGDSRRSRSWPSGRPASARDKACSAATGMAERESSEWCKGSSGRPRLSGADRVSGGTARSRLYAGKQPGVSVGVHVFHLAGKQQRAGCGRSGVKEARTQPRLGVQAVEDLAEGGLEDR